MRRFLKISSLLMLIASPHFCVGQEKVAIEPVQFWSNLATESKVEFQWLVKAPKGFKGRAEWTFADVSKRVLPKGRGERALAGDFEKGVPLKTVHPMPPLRDDVILQAELTIAVFADGSDKPEADLVKPVWIFPADPFFNRTKWLEELKITLFDPDAKSKTAAAFTALKVPHEEQRNVAALGELREGVLVIGAGASLKEMPELAEALVQAAVRGVPVLCLTPLDGFLPLPGADNALPAPASVSYQRRQVLTALDKRFDDRAWGPAAPVFTRGLVVKPHEDKVVGEFVAADKAWPWVQFDFPEKKGRLIVCCFALIEHWNDSPTPRFVLARVLERLTEASAPAK